MWAHAHIPTCSQRPDMALTRIRTVYVPADDVAAGAQALETRDMGSHGRTRTYRDPAGHLIQLFWKA